MPGDEQSSEGRRTKVKTLAIRLDPALHAQLAVIAQLRDSTITDEIREAVAAHVAAKANDPELTTAASGLIEEIDRDADARRAALSTLFGSSDAPKPSRRGSGRGGPKEPST